MRYIFPVSVDIYEASRRRAFYPQKICNAPINRGTICQRGPESFPCSLRELPSCGRGRSPQGDLSIFSHTRDTSFRAGPNFGYVQFPAKLCHVFRVEFGLRMYVTPRIGFNGHAGKGAEARLAKKPELLPFCSPPAPRLDRKLPIFSETWHPRLQNTLKGSRPFVSTLRKRRPDSSPSPRFSTASILC